MIRPVAPSKTMRRLPLRPLLRRQGLLCQLRGMRLLRSTFVDLPGKKQLEEGEEASSFVASSKVCSNDL